MGATRGGPTDVSYDDVYLGPVPDGISGGVTLTPRTDYCPVPCSIQFNATAVNSDGTLATGAQLALSVKRTGAAPKVTYVLTDQSGHATVPVTSRSMDAADVIASFVDNYGRGFASNTVTGFFISTKVDTAVGILIAIDKTPPTTAGNCTATAVRGTRTPLSGSQVTPSATGLVIVTAGHCVHGNSPDPAHEKPPGHTYSDFYFLPGAASCTLPASGFAAGEAFLQSPPRSCAPFGSWHGSEARVSSGYASTGDHAEDFAYVKLDPRPGSGATPVDATGGHVLGFHPTQSHGFRIVGYPTLTKSSSCTDADVGRFLVGPVSTFDLFEADCTLLRGKVPSGASGGPWFDLLTGDVGLVSDTAQPNVVYGSRLEDAAVLLWTCIDTGAC
jgi:hypothetical protein